MVNDNINFNNEDLSLFRENLYYCYYEDFAAYSPLDGFEHYAASLSLVFILRCLELKNKNKEIGDFFGKDGVFVNAFRNINSTKNSKHEENLKTLSEEYKDDFGLYLKSHWFERGTFENFYDAMFSKFYQIIDNLPQECIFIFMCEMMRGVTLKNSQLAYVKQKIQNQDLSSYLEKINYNPEYKLTGVNIIENGTKLYWTNHLCEKLFRGIGYLFAVAFILAIHAAVATIFILIINHWFLYVIYAVLALSASYFTISGVKNDSKPFEKCVGFMQWAYNKTVGYLMKILALHYPTNKIPEPPIINNYLLNQESIGQNTNTSKPQQQFDGLPKKKKTNDDDREIKLSGTKK